MQMVKDVETFMEAAGQLQQRNVHDDLYLSLIEEEYGELFEAIQNKDNVEELDACMDLIWVVLGYAITKGFDVRGAWEEVTRSNLAKIDPASGQMIRNAYGKVVKPLGWTPPNLTPFITR